MRRSLHIVPHLPKASSCVPGYFWVMDLETRKKHRLDGQKTGEVFGAVTWSADSTSLIYNEQHGVNTNSTRSIQQMAWRGTDEKDRNTPCTSIFQPMPKPWPTFSKTTGLRRTFMSVISRLSEPVRLTDANPWIREDRTLTQGEVLQWEGKGGMLIEGIYYPPVRKGRSSGKDPLIVFIHGGPAAAWEANFRTTFRS